MASPQAGIFALGTNSHAYLEFDLVARMLGADVGPDRLLAVTRPLTGAYYVIPSADRLAAFDGEAGAHG